MLRPNGNKENSDKESNGKEDKKSPKPVNYDNSVDFLESIVSTESFKPEINKKDD